jgi:hypothetical protein
LGSTLYGSAAAWDYAHNVMGKWEFKKKAALSGHPGKSTPLLYIEMGCRNAAAADKRLRSNSILRVKKIFPANAKKNVSQVHMRGFWNLCLECVPAAPQHQRVRAIH